MPRKKSDATAILEMAGDLARQTAADVIVVVADSGVKRASVEALNKVCQTLVVTRNKRLLKGIEESGVWRMQSEFDVDNIARFERLRQGIILGVEAGYIPKRSRLVCLTGVMGSRGVDTLLLTDASLGFEDFHPDSVAALAGDLPVGVVRTVLDLALEIGQEGRGGEPVGALFVVGDSARVMVHSREMTFDPFRGYSDQDKNICNPEIWEGVREVALMDGAFIVRDDGVILAGGRYITADAKGIHLAKGLGARPVAAAAISKHTNAIAVAISESTGTLRAFRDGEVVLRRVPSRRAKG